MRKKIVSWSLALVTTGLILLFLLYSTGLSYYWCSFFFDYWAGAKDRSQLERRMFAFYERRSNAPQDETEDLQDDDAYRIVEYVIFSKEVIEVHEEVDGTIINVIPVFE
jgi:hypothetical protein